MPRGHIFSGPASYHPDTLDAAIRVDGHLDVTVHRAFDVLQLEMMLAMGTEFYPREDNRPVVVSDTHWDHVGAMHSMDVTRFRKVSLEVRSVDLNL